MNSNATLRNQTTARAVELSAVLEQLAESHNTTNFDLHYIPNPVAALIEKWVSAGGAVWELIEPVDGFHPNQQAMSLIASDLVDFLEANKILPPVNPNNAKIQQLFGNMHF
jgi:acyloxyacyl hydrolase